MALTSFADLTIRRKLSVLLLLSSGIGLVVASVALISFAFSSSRAVAERDLDTLAQVIADNSAAALTFQDWQTAREVLSGLRAKQEIVFACLYSGTATDAELFASYGGAAGQYCPVSEMRARSANGLLVSDAPVELDNEQIGHLLLAQNLSLLQANLTTQVKITIAILAGSFVVSFLVAWVLQRYLTLPILSLSAVARQVTDSQDYSLRADASSADEVGGLAKDFNAMLEQIQASSSQLQVARDALAQEVQGTTRANQELQQALENLELAQDQLVQSEKLASLGGLVAGVAHEINTPVGVSVTAASTLHGESEKINARFLSGQMKKSDLQQFMELADESSEIILKNLARAADLIQSFKQVAVDQSSQERRRFAVRPYIDEVLLSLRPQLKKTRLEVQVECPDDLTIDSFPGAMAQIVTNLVGNSIAHAYEPGASGVLRFVVGRDGEQWIRLRYADDGRGIPAHELGRIFDPFFTTKRGSGGSGLGLHIVYNLATQILGGKIKVNSEPGHGVEFEIRFPAEARRVAA